MARRGAAGAALCAVILLAFCTNSLAAKGKGKSADVDRLTGELHAAVFDGRVGEAKRLLAVGASVKPISGRFSQTALHVAAHNGSPELCRMLIDAGSNVDQLMLAGEDKQHKRTALLFALEGWHEANHKPNVTAVRLAQGQELPQHRFAAVVRMLAAAGANVGARDQYGRNCLHLALQYGLRAALPLLATAKSCSARVPQPKVFVPNQQFGRWGALHFAANTRFRWKMLSTILLKQQGYASQAAAEEEGLDVELIRAHFDAAWQAGGSLPAAVLSADGLTIEREHLWPAVAQHSAAMVADLLASCKAADEEWSPVDLLVRKSAAGFTPLQLAVDSNDEETAAILVSEMLALGLELHAPREPVESSSDKEAEADLRPLLHLVSSRGNVDMAAIVFPAATECELDQWKRLPSAVSANAVIREVTEAWEAEHCAAVAHTAGELLACVTDASGTCIEQAVTDDCDFTVVMSLSQEEFERDFLAANKPVLVRGGVKDWPAVGKWSPAFLRDVYAQLPVRVGSIPYAGLYGEASRQASMGEFGRYSGLVESNEASKLMGDAPVLYVFDNELFDGDSAPAGIKNDFSEPSVIEGRHTHPVQFMWGPQGSGAPVHYHQNAVNGVILGEKQWMLYPPSSNFVSKQRAKEWFEEHGDDDRALRCVQRRGDLVFVPDSWGHAVLNTKETVALAFEFVFP